MAHTPRSIPRFARRGHASRLAVLCACALALSTIPAIAQRQLHWDGLEVTAHLNADGMLTIAETHAMVFTGDWNGGERTFNVRPRQSFAFAGIFRAGPGGWLQLREDPSLDDVDEYAWAETHTLRWRSRRPSDPSFAATTLRYEIRYALSNILLKEGETYRLDHDFAFPDRAGAINRFALRLTVDPVWQPERPLRPIYTVAPLVTGRSFVLDLPMRYTGSGVPAAFDTARPPEIVQTVSALLLVTMLAVAWFFVRERSIGRFAPLASPVDEAWLREHLLKYPAEVVAAAWDEDVGPPEVVTLIGRMVADGTLASSFSKGTFPTMSLHLKVDRGTLDGHERTLVERLFFENRTETSTTAVRDHYQATGFDPAKEIRKELEAAVEAVLPPGRPPRRVWLTGFALFAIGVGLIAANWFRGYPGVFLVTLPAIVVAVTGWIAGHQFRTYLAWGYRAALLCLIPAFTIALGTAAYLWFVAGTGSVELPPTTVYGVGALALACVLSAINALKTRRHRDALAFRKALASARAFFIDELGKDRPALRDEWYPWLLAFELGKQADAWSTSGPSSRYSSQRDVFDDPPPATSASSTSLPEGRWSGFGGGRSGGAGANASWQAAAAGMAASVSPPSSSGSSGDSDSGSSGSSSGGSSSSGSSGGGGGGGW